jgi:very-short-patch-repair endonuclease
MRNPLLQRRARVLRRTATDAERQLWRQIRGRQLEGYRFRRQVAIAGYIADFACLEARLVVELDGGQHLEQEAYDKQRDSRLHAAGFRVLRFWDNDVLRETQSVVEAILAALLRCPHPGLPPQAGEGEVR